MKYSKAEVVNRLTNWKTIVAIVSLIGFLFTKFGMSEAKSFLDELMPYVFTVGISLGIWTSHDNYDQSKENKNEKGDV